MDVWQITAVGPARRAQRSIRRIAGTASDLARRPTMEEGRHGRRSGGHDTGSRHRSHRDARASAPDRRRFDSTGRGRVGRAGRSGRDARLADCPRRRRRRAHLGNARGRSEPRRSGLGPNCRGSRRCGVRHRRGVHALRREGRAVGRGGRRDGRRVRRARRLPQPERWSPPAVDGRSGGSLPAAAPSSSSRSSPSSSVRPSPQPTSRVRRSARRRTAKAWTTSRSR